MTPKPRLTYPFQPHYDERSRVLVLGSFPSEGSVKGGGNYGHRSNQFWRLMADLLGDPALWRGLDFYVGSEVMDMDPPDDAAAIVRYRWEHRYEVLRKRRIALWDVIASCERKGPHEDGKIRNAKPNDVPGLIRKLPNLRAVFCNGDLAHKLFLMFTATVWYEETMSASMPTITVHRMPSPSAANRTPYAKKLEAWRAILPHYLEEP